MSHPMPAAIKIFVLGAALLSAMSAALLLPQLDVDATRALIRWTARTSLVFFVMAFTAQALFVLWPGQLTTWLRRHRRPWGWLLVLSHTIHAAGIGAVAVMDPALFAKLAPVGNLISGGLAYALLWAMGATSFDRSAAWLGRTWWARLHTWGSHYLWLSFMVANGKRIPHDGWYLGPVLILVLAMALRWWARSAVGTRARQGGRSQLHSG